MQIAEAKVRGSLFYCVGCNKTHVRNVCRPELRVAIGIPLQALEKAKYALMQVVKK